MIGSGQVENHAKSRRSWRDPTGWPQGRDGVSTGRRGSSCCPRFFWSWASRLYPVLSGIRLSFFKWELATIGRETFVGLRNFEKMLTDSRFLASVEFTLLYTVAAVSVEIVAGTALALLLNQPIKGMRYFSTVLLMPVALAPVAVGIAWRFFLNTEYGTMSYLLRTFGLAESQSWLARINTARWVLIGIDIWWATPFVMLVVLSGLKSLPDGTVRVRLDRRRVRAADILASHPADAAAGVSGGASLPHDGCAARL